MTILYGFVAGIAAYWLFNRFLMKVIRNKFSSPESRVRKTLLDGMGYDGLVSFQKAVEVELARRRGSETT